MCLCPLKKKKPKKQFYPILDDITIFQYCSGLLIAYYYMIFVYLLCIPQCIANGM